MAGGLIILFFEVQKDRPVSDINRASKVTEHTLVQNLCFALYGDGAQLSIKNDGQSLIDDNELRERVCIPLRLMFDMITKKEFDRDKYAWISYKLIAENFERRKINQYNKMIIRGVVDYKLPKAIKLRSVFAAICAVARDVLGGHGMEGETLSRVRHELNIERSQHNLKARLAVLGQIEHEMKIYSNPDMRPDWPVTFDSEGQPVIKTKKSYFPTQTGDDVRQIKGQFVVYRRALTSKAEYIREYIVIDVKPFGITFRWESRSKDYEQEVIWSGVGLLSEGALWLIAFCEAPFKRLRVLTANMLEWRRHANDENKTSCCTAMMISHLEDRGEKKPMMRVAIIKRVKQEYWKSEKWNERSKYLDRVELGGLISEDEINKIA